MKNVRRAIWRLCVTASKDYGTSPGVLFEAVSQSPDYVKVTQFLEHLSEDEVHEAATAIDLAIEAQCQK